MAEAEQKDASEPAGERIRETAKWLTVSLAAIGGVLITGIQFSNLGAAKPWDERFVGLIVGATLSLAGVTTLLWGAIRTAVTPSVSVTMLDDAFRTAKLKRWSLQKAINKANSHLKKDASLLGGYTSFEQLAEEYRAGVTQRLAAAGTYYADPTNADSKRVLEVAIQRASLLSVTLVAVLKMASYNLLARRWRQMQWLAAIGATLAVAGVGLFTWGANPPKAATASAATPAVVDTPTVGSLTLTHTGQGALGKTLGETCPTDAALHVLRLEATDSGADILVQHEDCKSVRVLITPVWGQFSAN